MRSMHSPDENAGVVISTHRVTPGRMASFSTSVKGLLGAASRSQGYLDGRMEKASGESETWLVICWFDSAESAGEWGRSRSHATWREYVGRFATRVDPPPRPAQAPPGATPPSPPPRWKTALVTLIGVFPAVLLVNVTVIPRVTGLPLLARTFVLCVCVTGLMTWVLMPQVMKVLGPWLRRGTIPVAAPGGATPGVPGTDQPGTNQPDSDQPHTGQPDAVDAPTSISHGLRPLAVLADNEARQGSRPPRASRSRHAAPATFPSGQQSRSHRR
jgi:antibiotic biosynthesis monooxygenase (ABM) superfamily enzyme